MKLRGRMIVTFLIMLLLPLVLLCMVWSFFSHYRMTVLKQDFGEEFDYGELIQNPVWMLGGITASQYRELQMTAHQDPEKLRNKEYLNELNDSLKDRYSFLIVSYDNSMIYNGSSRADEEMLALLEREKNRQDEKIDAAFFMDREEHYLIKEETFSGSRGRAWIIMDVRNIIGQTQFAIKLFFISFIMILLLTALILTLWIYSGIIRPIKLLRVGANEMIEGNLDFSLMEEEPVFSDMAEGAGHSDMDNGLGFSAVGKKQRFFHKKHQDEMELFIRDFERMRIKTKETMDERIQFENDLREMISNISHDLKTPLTAIKGYTEGIMDGVADTKEKQEKYLHTIYKKADEMIYLVDELSFYSKIDCNTIPYEFRKVNLNDYFMDCISEFALDLEVKNISLSFSNYVNQSVEIVADVEKLRRVLHNIIGNSQKYMDKEKGSIQIRIREKDIFVEVEVEDNGCGIDEQDLDSIFDRFFRSDASRNSKRRGSGLGLAISRKIIEDHGGKIWAESIKGEGTSIFFTLCKAEDRMVFSMEDVIDEEKDRKEEKTWRRKKRSF